ncbi:lecithin retinol acyltransferase family protein [Campylobacter concisus]|jgi:NC domain family|uniref:Lecithin retinol acyltransferase family protein n=2 Tax=Campylobacter concisus TaxID=199 RepID=A0A9E1FAG7_9BACT|nr:lecithin retinol acyltransferase family protein [Campylobacter concisus]EAT97823.1 lecithin retinol acyltransferase family protein [Campylobacter concisus 13826]MBS5829596.1 lecithin retinol acyltransferase family protein [Campylobacter concisus]
MENLLKIGDHVFVDRSVLGIKLYEHHGIYVGDDMVVHYNGLAHGIVLEKSCFEEILSNVVPLDKRNIAKVEMTSLEEFASGDVLQVKKHADAPFSGQEVALRAKERIGEQKYNLIINNCEHFCNECVFGEHVSEQVQNVKQNSAIFNEVEPFLEQIIGELFGAQSKDDVKQVFTKSLTKLTQNSRDSAEQKAREMIKEKGDKINLQIEKFMSKNTKMNAAFQNIRKDVKAKIARDFNIKI